MKQKYTWWVLGKQAGTWECYGTILGFVLELMTKQWKQRMSKLIWPGVVVHTYNTNIQEAGVDICEFEVSLLYTASS